MAQTQTHAEGRYVGKRVGMQVLTPDEIRQIHEATIDVLTNVGVKFHSTTALDILAEHGAGIDRETTVAKLTPAMVEQALATRAESWTVAGRLPEFDLPFDGEHVYLSGDGCGVFRREFDGSVRTSRKQDLADAARVIDALPNLSATSAIVSAQDCPTESRVLHEFDACVRNSAKHTIVVSIKEDWEARSLIRMAEALAGGSDELRAKPRFSAIICTVSPLHQERFGMDLALALAEAGVPILFYPMPILGATAPVTIAGAAVVNNAEFLSGLTLVQLAHPGARVMHGGGPTAMYMDSGAYASNSPEALLLRAVQGQMADFYSVPAWYGAGATTAKEPGVQSGYENTLAMMTAYLAGADCTFGTGLLDGSRILALEQIVTDDETFGMLTRILRGIEVTDETIARDLIAEMGFAGNYLFDSHTRKHVRELWRASLSETGNYDQWRAGGARSTVDSARERVAEILATEPGHPFPDDLGHEFDAIIAAAEDDGR
jgi:trimethylamine--corrinoid protein Co-methyltransferase